MMLEGKSAVVTGGGTGIGWGIAQALAAEGCQVVVAGRREAVLQAACQSDENSARLKARAVDVSDRASVADLFQWADEQLGQIDILVNSAGVNIQNRTMEAMRPEQWDEVLAINATGTYNCMFAVLPQMRERSDGLIINISSIAGKRASQLGGVAYSASKFAMTALGTCVANEESLRGIRVTNVYPGEVDTPILENRPKPVSAEHRARILQPEDFGKIVVAIAALPPRAHVAEMVLKPTTQGYE